MSKNKIISIIGACAVIFSILACYLIYQYMSPARSTVYVFNSAYSAGKQVTSDMLNPVQVDSTIVISGKTTNIGNQFVTPEQYASIIQSGDSLRMDVSEGMPLTTSMLSISGGSTVEMNMKSDAIAVTVPVDSFSGITNDLKAGAKVNVYSSTDSKTTLIQQNKRILEVFYDGSNISGVSIEQDIDESMELIYAATYGQIYLGLVDGTGYQSREGDDPVYDPYAQQETENASTDTVYYDDEMYDALFGNTGASTAMDDTTEQQTEISTEQTEITSEGTSN